MDNYGEKGAADKAMRALRSGGVYILLPAAESTLKRPKAGVTQLNFGYTQSSDHAPLDRPAGYFDEGAIKAHVFAQVPLAEAAQAFALSERAQWRARSPSSWMACRSDRRRRVRGRTGD